jgi:hypothetical protein
MHVGGGFTVLLTALSLINVSGSSAVTKSYTFAYNSDFMVKKGKAVPVTGREGP